MNLYRSITCYGYQVGIGFMRVLLPLLLITHLISVCHHAWLTFDSFILAFRFKLIPSFPKPMELSHRVHSMARHGAKYFI